MNSVPSSFTGNPISAKYSLGYSTFSAHSGQIVRTSRCAMNDFTTDASRNGSQYMSSERGIPPTASFVCRVLKTRWEGLGARIAIAVDPASTDQRTLTLVGLFRPVGHKPML